MLGALSVVRSGLEGEQTKMNVIANNLANEQTPGFKAQRSVFEDLLYREGFQPGGFTSQVTNYPSGLQEGAGSAVVATEPLDTQGSLKQTGNALDLAINGNGYFQVLTPGGQTAYTRDGSFQLNAQGQVVTAKGYLLQPPLTIPQGAQSITVGTDGTVSVQMPNQANAQQIGVVQLASFVNPAGLQRIGDNLAVQTQASGAPISGQPTINGLGSLNQGYLEESNVKVVDEMIGLIETQRAYEIDTQAAKSAGQMLGDLASVNG